MELAPSRQARYATIDATMPVSSTTHTVVSYRVSCDSVQHSGSAYVTMLIIPKFISTPLRATRVVELHIIILMLVRLHAGDEST